MPEDKDPSQILMWLHLSAFSGFLIPIGIFLGPLILWLIYKDESKQVDLAGRRALNFSFSILLYNFLVFLSYAGVVYGAVFTLGADTVPIVSTASTILMALGIAALGVIWFVAIIKAALAAKKGRDYSYPVSVRFFRISKSL